MWQAAHVRRAALLVAVVCGAACGGSARTAAPPTEPAPVDQVAPDPAPARAAEPVATAAADVVPTAAGDLRIIPVHHGTVAFEHAGKVFVVDPWSRGPLETVPKADVILITDVHDDHFDAAGIDSVRKDGTVIVAPPAVASQLYRVTQMRNGEKQEIHGVTVEAVPMYNLVRGPSAKERWHEKGRGNGYVLTFAGTRVYVSGDTECTPEMKALTAIDVAFVCMNLPYTMTPAEAGACIHAFRPKIVYPYHFRDQEPAEVSSSIQGGGIEVRIRDWY